MLFAKDHEFAHGAERVKCRAILSIFNIKSGVAQTETRERRDGQDIAVGEEREKPGSGPQKHHGVTRADKQIRLLQLSVQGGTEKD